MLDSRRALRILRADFPDFGRIFSSSKEYDAKKYIATITYFITYIYSYLKGGTRTYQVHPCHCLSRPSMRDSSFFSLLLVAWLLPVLHPKSFD